MALPKKLKSLLFTSIILSLTACGGGSTKNEPDPIIPVEPVAFDYQGVINELISDEIPGIVLLVETPKTRFLGSAGVSNLETQRAMQIGDTIPTGSSGKKMIALLAAQLDDEGLLNLDDTLDTWLSEDILSRIPNSYQITMRQLLNHTSGVFNHPDVDDGDAEVNLLLAEPDVLKTDIDFLELIFDHPAFFLPGEGYEYSNSGYSLAALIMDQVLGEHHSIAMRNRFFDPLGMTSTYYKGSEATLGDFVSGYITDRGVIDTRPYLINSSNASAPIVSSVEDMAIFLKALITDDSFANNAVRNTLFGEDNLIDIGDGDKYGLGIGVLTRKGQTIYAHAGLTYGYSAQSIYIEDIDTSIVLFFNCGNGGVNTCSTVFDDLIVTVLNNVQK